MRRAVTALMRIGRVFVIVAVGILLPILVLSAAIRALQPDSLESQESPGDHVTEDGSPSVPSRQTPRHQRGGSHEYGLHYSPEEVAIWRQRAEDGPYRKPGDARENSPGDWERIASNAEAFLEEPDNSRWEGPSGDGCVQPDDEGPPTLEASEIRDAAFYYLVMEEEVFRDEVKEQLLEQASEDVVNFADQSRWCPQVLNDLEPALPMAQWLTKLLFAYDYVGRHAFTVSEREQLDDWFRGAAEFFQTDIEGSLNDNFVDRKSGNYEISTMRSADPDCDGHTAFYGSDPVCAIARYYNNRRAAQARLVGLVGVHQNDPDLIATAERFVREFLAFSVYPEGYFGEFERWRDRLPDLGWAYAANAVGAAVTIADHMARAGDPGLYEFSTSFGAQGTEGGPKSLRSAIQFLGRYVDGSYERYATEDESHVGNEDYLIDGSHQPSEWYSLHDVTVTPGNVYYQDEFIHMMYTRTGPGMEQYPGDPAPNGDHEIWKGEAGIYPGVLFMFGEMEGEVWPYPEPKNGSDAALRTRSG